MSYFLYLVRCADNSLYCGITTNLKKRLAEHNSQTPRGAKYLRAKKPVHLVYQEEHGDRSSALRREYEIKQWPKNKKEQLIYRFT